jgi:hypothetical protein
MNVIRPPDLTSISKTGYSAVFAAHMATKPARRLFRHILHEICALAAAIDYLIKIGLDRIEESEQELLTVATRQISAMRGVRLLGTARQKAAVLSFLVEGVHPRDVGTILDQEGVAIRTGHHCCQPLLCRLGVEIAARASLEVGRTQAGKLGIVIGEQQALQQWIIREIDAWHDMGRTVSNLFGFSEEIVRPAIQHHAEEWVFQTDEGAPIYYTNLLRRVWRRFFAEVPGKRGIPILVTRNSPTSAAGGPYCLNHRDNLKKRSLFLKFHME